VPPGPQMPSLATPSATFDRLLAAVINGGNPGSPGWSELSAVMASYRARKSGDPGAARALAGVPGPLAAALNRWYRYLDAGRAAREARQ
jgi:hypothetical protein